MRWRRRDNARRVATAAAGRDEPGAADAPLSAAAEDEQPEAARPAAVDTPAAPEAPSGRRGGEPAEVPEAAAGRPAGAQAPEAPSGPWDSGADYPQIERVDCGSLLVPVSDGTDIQINVSEEQGVWVAVVHAESAIQLQAFAAPRQQGLWDEIRQEIAENVAEAGGSSQERDGPFGPELHATVRVSDETGAAAQPQQIRFLGADGSRWFLRGLISGPAATDAALAGPFEEVFSQVVVVRGQYPKPPKEQLEIRLPDEARQALETELAAEGYALPEGLLGGPPPGGTDDPPFTGSP